VLLDVLAALVVLLSSFVSPFRGWLDVSGKKVLASTEGGDEVVVGTTLDEIKVY
jgi:hypothetical protein